MGCAVRSTTTVLHWVRIINFHIVFIGFITLSFPHTIQTEDNHLGASSKESTAAATESTNLRTTKEQLILTTSEASTTAVTADEIISGNPFAGIKIKEITKPEEIRITDDKPKLFKPPQRTTSLAASSSSTVAAETTTTPTMPPSVPSSSSEEPADVESSGQSASSATNDVDHIIEPETHIVTTGEVANVDTIDDLSSFVGDNAESSEGSKIIRQTAEPMLAVMHSPDGDLNADSTVDSSSTTTEPQIVISDKLIDFSSFSSSSSTTEGDAGESSSSESSIWSSTPTYDNDGAWSSSSWSSADQVYTSESPRESNNGQLIYINGKPFQLRETDGLTRGSDDEEEPGRKSQASVAYATTIAPMDVERLASPSSQSTIEASGSSEQVFEAVYYDPQTEAPFNLLSSEVFETVDHRAAETDHTNSIEASSKQQTSQEFIDVTGTVAGNVAQHLAFDGSGSADGPVTNVETADSIEGSTDASVVSSSTSDSSSSETSTTPAYSASTSPTSVDDLLLESSSAAPAPVTTAVNQDDDKTREFPEQSDDLSLHSQQMLEESVGEAKSMASADAVEESSSPAPDEDVTLLRVIPIGRNAIDRSPGSSETSTSFADVQERSPGEPWLVPEWERTNGSSTEPAIRPPKINRKDSLILLPVNDGAMGDFGRSSAALAAASSTVAPVADQSTASANDDTVESSGADSTASHELANHVSGGYSEGRSSIVDDAYGIDHQRHSDSKLKYYSGDIPFEIFRY